MFRKLLLTLGFLFALASPALAQNTTCSDRPSMDVSNACANTRFVHNGFINCVVFTDLAKGCVPASGGGTVNFLRADGTFAPTGAGGSAIVGMLLPWAGASVPDTYLLAYGQAVSRSTYASLFSAMSATATISCTSGSPNITVSADIANRMPIGGAIEGVACFIAGTTVSSKSGTTLTLSNNAGATTSTAIVFIPWGNGDGSTTFNIPNLQGRAVVGRDNMSGSAAGVVTAAFYGTNPDSLGANGGAQSTTLSQSALPNTGIALTGTLAGTPGGVSVTSSVSTVFQTPSVINTSSGVGGAGFDGGQNSSSSISAITSTGSFTPAGSVSGTTSSINGGVAQTAFSQIQPSVTIDWIIKALPDSAVGDTITVGVTNVAGGSTTNILYNNAGKVGEYSLATAAERLAGTANKIIEGSTIYLPETVVTYGTTTSFDFSTFLQAGVTLTGDITTMNVSNVTAGRSGTIAFIQDGSGGHTSVFNSVFKFPGGTTPTLTATAGAVDILSYACRTATFCTANLLLDVK